ncbi:DUF3742 family protein [Pseudomonas yamanorum]|uniref:DUF3742 family protein n=1 Tax=Pseudomonas yamanorum TaxID=515393 RepID=UPI003D35FA0F
MLTQNPVHVSRAQRWAYVCRVSMKRGCRKLKALEARVAGRAAVVGVPAGNLLIRGSFLIVRLALLVALFFVSVWLFAFIVMMLAVLTFLWLRVFIGSDQQEVDPGPDYLGADLYIGDFDDNGHYIGDCKSSD